MEDTIVAIATPLGTGGLAVLRVSGTTAIDVASKIFVSSNRVPVSEYPSHSVHFGRISHNGTFIDHVLLTVMRAPHTYTKEDTVEISCHGGSYIARAILSVCLDSGARIAEPGEFTKRAFLNGRIDLTQAEAVMDIISAQTERSHAAAYQVLDGHLYRHIEKIHNKLFELLVSVEANIDFPDEDLPREMLSNLGDSIIDIRNQIKATLNTAKQGKILREGVNISIIGRPNVGKSSLFNALVGYERTIVSSIPGTTRDTIEELVNLKGIPVVFVDSAGIRLKAGNVEGKSIERSHKSFESSDYSLCVLDGSKALSNDDKMLISLCAKKPHFVVINKIDKPLHISYKEISKQNNAIHVSSTTGKGIESLCAAIHERIFRDSEGKEHYNYAINERQAFALKKSLDTLDRIIAEEISTFPLEIVAQYLRIAIDSVGEVVGKTTTEDILQSIFGSFCIGK